MEDRQAGSWCLGSSPHEYPPVTTALRTGNAGDIPAFRGEPWILFAFCDRGTNFGACEGAKLVHRRASVSSSYPGAPAPSIASTIPAELFVVSAGHTIRVAGEAVLFAGMGDVRVSRVHRLWMIEEWSAVLLFSCHSFSRFLSGSARGQNPAPGAPRDSALSVPPPL